MMTPYYESNFLLKSQANELFTIFEESGLPFQSVTVKLQPNVFGRKIIIDNQETTSRLEYVLERNEVIINLFGGTVAERAQTLANCDWLCFKACLADFLGHIAAEVQLTDLWQRSGKSVLDGSNDSISLSAGKSARESSWGSKGALGRFTDEEIHRIEVALDRIQASLLRRSDLTEPSKRFVIQEIEHLRGEARKASPGTWERLFKGFAFGVVTTVGCDLGADAVKQILSIMWNTMEGVFSMPLSLLP